MSRGLTALRHEREAEKLGVLLWTEVQRAMRSAIKGRAPQVYADGAHSWADALEDSCQGFAEALLSNGQLDYALNGASTVSDFRALMTEQARRHLSRNRVRGAIDQLLTRSRKIIMSPEGGYVVHSRKGKAVRTFALAPLAVEARQATDGEIREAARACAVFPISPGIGGDHRAPPIYSTRVLELLLRRVCEVVPTVVSLSDLDRIFRELLTDWVVSDLESLEEAVSQRTAEIGPAIRVEAESGAQVFVASLTPESRRLLALLLAGATGDEIGRALRVTRQTVHSRKKQLQEALRPFLAPDVPGADQCFFDELHVQLVEAGAA